MQSPASQTHVRCGMSGNINPRAFDDRPRDFRVLLATSLPRRATPQLVAPLPLTRLGGSSGQRGGVPNPGWGLVSWFAPDNGQRWPGFAHYDRRF